MTAEATALGLRRAHQLPDGGQNFQAGLVVSFEFALELGQLVRELPVRGDHFAQLHECPHDVNAHLNCSRATQGGGCHDRAVLSERIGREARIPVLL